jgi:hypothetical protein
MAYTVNPGSAAVTTVGSSAGQIPTTADIELVNAWMKAVNPETQEVMDWLGPLRKEVNQQTHFIGQSHRPKITGTLGVATVSADPTIDVTGAPADLGVKVGDKMRIREYYPGQTVYFDPTKTTYHRIVTVDAGSVEASANVGAIHPVTESVWSIYSSAHPMATAFDTANVFRGERFEQGVQRFQSGYITVDERMRHTPTWESKDHFVDDMENLKQDMREKVNGALINSTYVAESGSTPGEIRGMLDWADDVGANVLALAGKQVSIHHFRQVVTAKRKVHNKGAGKTIMLDMDSMECIDLVLEPYKLYNEKSNSISIQVNDLNFRWGNLTFMPIRDPWPDGTALITDKPDWGAGHYSGMPWRPVRPKNEETGAPTEKFAIYCDYTLDCYDVYRQILITGINTFVDRYAGRRTYGQAG